MESFQRLAAKVRTAHIEHFNYQRAYKQVHAHIHLMPPGNVLVLVGPTRVGKSALLRNVMRDVYGAGASDGQHIPCAQVEASTTNKGAMSNRYLTLQILQAVQHPFHASIDSALTRATETTMRARIPLAFKARATQVLLIDEAHHLLRTGNWRTRGSILDSVKCLGNETGVRIVLGAGYELLASCFDSSHLNGRLTIIDFARYRPVPSDIDHFERVLATFDELLPWTTGVSLYSLRQFIYDGTLGCVGLLSGWIQAALAQMVSEGDRRLRTRHFSATRFEEQLEEIRRDIEIGEGRLTPLRINKDAAESSSKSHRRGRPGTARRNRRPGLRKPVRDPVGEDKLP